MENSGEQIMSDLPLARLDIGQAPFTHTRVGFFDPIYVKRDRSEEKKVRMYIYMHEYWSSAH